MRITLTRENWPAALNATVTVDISFDNGQTFRPWIGPFGLVGGDIVRDGVLQTESWKQSTWPGEFDGKDALGRDKRRELKGSDALVTLITNRQFRSTITLEAI